MPGVCVGHESAEYRGEFLAWLPMKHSSDQPFRMAATASHLTRWVALGAWVFVASGLPLPAFGPRPGSGAANGTVAKDRSLPFPCMDSPCGCATAEQCFASCCCHSPAERLAWARAHDVNAAVLESLERIAAPVAGCSSGGTDDAPGCCTSVAASGGCCSDSPTGAAEPPGADRTASPRPGGIVLRAMLACGGTTVGGLATAVLPTSTVPPVSFATVGTWIVAAPDAKSLNTPRAPDPPPPRRV